MNGNDKRSIRSIKKDTWEGVFFFHSGDSIYRTHFPGHPVVPGSLVVHAFLKAAEEADFSGEQLVIENFRFIEFILPGRYPFRMELRENRMHCFISDGNKKIVTGILRR